MKIAGSVSRTKCVINMQCYAKILSLTSEFFAQILKIKVLCTSLMYVQFIYKTKNFPILKTVRGVIRTKEIPYPICNIMQTLMFSGLYFCTYYQQSNQEICKSLKYYLHTPFSKSFYLECCRRSYRNKKGTLLAVAFLTVHPPLIFTMSTCQYRIFFKGIPSKVLHHFFLI